MLAGYVAEWPPGHPAQLCTAATPPHVAGSVVLSCPRVLVLCTIGQYAPYPHTELVREHCENHTELDSRGNEMKNGFEMLVGLPIVLQSGRWFVAGSAAWHAGG